MKRIKKVTVAMTLVLAVILVMALAMPATAYYELLPSTNPSGHFKVIWGFEEDVFRNGLKLGQKEDTKGLVLEPQSAPDTYEIFVRNDGKGQSGKYLEIKVHGKVNDINYLNPQLKAGALLGHIDRKFDFTGYDEFWYWLDASNFGEQAYDHPITGAHIELFDFAVMLYEEDPRESVKDPKKWERWAPMPGSKYYVENGKGGWTAMACRFDQIASVPVNYKGWVRMPFDQLKPIVSLGAGNMVFDGKNIVDVTLGIPINETTYGKSLYFDSLMLYSKEALPEKTTTTTTIESGTSATLNSNGGTSSVTTDESGNSDVSDGESSDPAVTAPLSSHSAVSQSDVSDAAILNKPAGFNWWITAIIVGGVLIAGGSATGILLWRRKTARGDIDSTDLPEGRVK